MATTAGASSISALLQRMRSGRPAQQRQAAAELADVSALSLGARQALVATGAVPVLLQLVDSADARLRRGVLITLHNIAHDQPDVTSAFAGGLAPLVRQLASSGASAFEQQAAASLMSDNMQGQDASVDANRRVLLDAGCLPVLVRMLRSRDALSQQQGARGIGDFTASQQPAFSDAAVAVPALTAALQGRSDSYLWAPSPALSSCWAAAAQGCGA